MNGEVRSLQPDVADELVRIGGEAYEWRRRAGLTQRAMEALTGIDQTTICKFEKGRLPGFRLHHVARIRLACKTGRRVEPADGRRQPTRPLMTPDSSPTADDFGGRTGKSLEREGVSRRRGRLRQAEAPTEAPPLSQGPRRGGDRESARGGDREWPRGRPRDEDASEAARSDPSIGRANTAPRQR